MRILLKELAIFGVLLLALAFLMHGGSLGERLEIALGDPSHFKHVIFWVLPIYLLGWIPRLGFRWLKRWRSKG